MIRMVQFIQKTQNFFYFFIIGGGSGQIFGLIVGFYDLNFYGHRRLKSKFDPNIPSQKGNNKVFAQNLLWTISTVFKYFFLLTRGAVRLLVEIPLFFIFVETLPQPESGSLLRTLCCLLQCLFTLQDKEWSSGVVTSTTPNRGSVLQWRQDWHVRTEAGQTKEFKIPGTIFERLEHIGGVK